MKEISRKTAPPWWVVMSQFWAFFKRIVLCVSHERLRQEIFSACVWWKPVSRTAAGQLRPALDLFFHWIPNQVCPKGQGWGSLHLPEIIILLTFSGFFFLHIDFYFSLEGFSVMRRLNKTLLWNRMAIFLELMKHSHMLEWSVIVLRRLLLFWRFVLMFLNTCTVRENHSPRPLCWHRCFIFNASEDMPWVIPRSFFWSHVSLFSINAPTHSLPHWFSCPGKVKI